jgi:hypothetical protein
MPDSTLQFQTRVDLSGLNTGVAEAQAVVGKFGSVATASMSEAAQATNRLADAQRQLGAAAAAGSAEAAAIIAEYQAAVDATSTSVAGLDAVEQKETATLRTGMSTRMAAAAEFRVLEGSVMGSTRAAAALVSMLPGVGAALQLAFPLFGAVALLEIIGQIGTAFISAFDLGGEHARALDQELTNISLDIRRSTDDLNLQIDKLQQEQAKLEKRPFNGTKLVLDEAAVAADHLSERLEHVIDEEIKAVKAMGGSAPQRVLGITANTHDEQVMLEEHKKYMSQAITTQQQFNEELSFSGALQAHLTQLKAQQAEADKNELDSGVASGINLKSKIDATQRLIEKQHEEQQNVQATMALEKQESIVQKDKDAKPIGPKGPDIDTSRLKVIEEQFVELQEKMEAFRGRALTAGEAAAFWQPFLAEFAADAAKYRALVSQAAELPPTSSVAHQLLLEAQKLQSANEAYKRVLTEVEKAQTDSHKLLFSEVLRADPAAAKALANGSEEYDQAVRAIARDSEEAGKASFEMAKGLEAVKKMTAEVNLLQQETNANNLHQQQEAIIAMNQQKATSKNATSLVPDPAQQLDQLRTFHAQALAEDIRFIQQEIQIYAQEPRKVEQLEKQLAEARRRADQQWLVDTDNISKQVAQKLQQSYQTMQNDVNQFLAKTLSGQETWANAAIQLYKKVSDQFILNVLKMAEQYLVGLATQKAGALSQIEVDAKTAAAGAYAATSSIPIIGPVLAPIAAAAAFTGVLAFGAFEQGGIVGGSSGMAVPIIAHAGERVLSAPQTQNFERMVNQSTQNSNRNINLHYAPNVSAFDRSGFRSTLNAHKDDIIGIVRQAINTGSLSRG